jgi:hypothetical protein
MTERKSRTERHGLKQNNCRNFTRFGTILPDLVALLILAIVSGLMLAGVLQ